MTNSTRKIGVLSIALLIAAVFVIFHQGLSLSPAAKSQHLVGKPAQELSLILLQGREYLPTSTAHELVLSSLKGSLIVLNFWASWCQSCVAQGAVLEKLWQLYRDANVKVIGVAVHDSPQDVRKFVKNSPKSYIIGVDKDGKSALHYGVTGVPETVLIDRNGAIIEKLVGPLEFDKLKSKVEALRL